MARTPRRQVDPFTAGDPIMPWDEPGGGHVPLGTNGVDWKRPEDAGGRGDGHECWADDDRTVREPERQRADDAQATRTGSGAGAQAGRKRGASPKKPSAPSRATAPAPAEAAGGPSPHDTRHKERGGRLIAGCVRLFGILFAIPLAIFIIGGLVICGADFPTTSHDPDSGTTDTLSVDEPAREPTPDPSEELRARFEDQADEFLTGLATPSGDDLASARQAADAYLTRWYIPGGLSSIGVDPEQFATWALTGMTHSMADSYALAEKDGTYDCSTYFDLRMRDAATVLADLSSYAYELDYEAVGAGRELTAEQKAEVQERLAALEANAEANSRDRFLSLEGTGTCDADGSNPHVELSREARDDFIRSLFGV